MAHLGLAGLLRAAGALGLVTAATVQASAGGLAIREESSYGQGSSFAGVAAGGDLSSMFWNPATMTQMPGIQTEMVATGIFPYAANTPSAGSTLLPLGGTNNTADQALVPSGYASWQVTPNLWLGLSLNSPFGLAVRFPDLWAGRDYAAGNSSLKTYNATPTFAYRINDWISIGAGVQIQYANATVARGPTPFISEVGFVPLDASLSGTGWGYGFTAGVTVTPTPTTTIGLGYRSAINQKIDGTLVVSPPLPSTTSVGTTVNLPDSLSLGLRQSVGPQLTLLGTIEWTDWSRIGTSIISTSSGVQVAKIPFEYQDGWFFSIGAEYQWTDRLAVRGGIGYEKSPITDNVRIPLLPDNDRIWLSVGSTYHLSRDLAIDLAYSHIFVKSTPIDVSLASGNPSFDGITYIGNVSSHVDIVSVAMKYRWDDAAPAPTRQMYVK